MGNEIGEGNGKLTGTSGAVSAAYHEKQIKTLRQEFEKKRDDVARDAGIAALEELKRRMHAIFPGKERCAHASEAMATVYWLQHQIKIGEIEL